MINQRLEESHGLNATQLAGIRQLEAACNQAEGLAMKLNWNTLHSRPSDEINDFLYYIGDSLVGYLALYTFNQREAEVSAMTHPAYRRQGIFKQLLAASRAELTQRGRSDLVFICEQAAISGRRCMQAIGASYDYSEYRMTLQAAVEPAPDLPELQLRPAVLADLDDLAEMDERFFGVPVETARRHLEQDLADHNHHIWTATVGQKRIGKLGVLQNEAEAYIFGVAVVPESRHKGYGRKMLTDTVQALLARGWDNISLEVACTNESALSIYKRCGFRAVTVYDYYRLPVSHSIKT